MSMSGLYVAHEEGYFAAVGLEVEIQQMLQTAHAAPLLVSGELDAAFLVLSPALINAVAKGALLRIVAAREMASPNCGSAGALYGRREVFPDGLADPAQLKGKRVAFSGRANIGEFYLDSLLAEAGLSSNDVESVPLGTPELVAALVGGNVDAIVFSHVERDLDRPDVVKGMGLAQVYPNLQFSFVFFGPSLMRGDVETGVRFLTAYLRGTRDFLAGKTPRYLTEMARLTGRDPGYAQNACRNILAPDGVVDPRSVDRCIEWAVRKGYCPRSAAVARFIDTRFLDEIRRRELKSVTE
jgi:NitT/TauT family transport system substrate-binding protein